MSQNGGSASSGWSGCPTYSIPRALRNLFQNKLSMDVTFSVGVEQTEVKGHKLILSSRSEVLATMLDQRWSCRDSSGKDVIQIGPGIGANAFEKFIKFIYTDDIKECLGGAGFQEVLELSSLGDMYGFSYLTNAAKTKISRDLVTDYKNCFITLEHVADDNLLGLAYAVLKRNLYSALTANDMKVKWTAEIWRNVLSEESLPPNVKEIHLFVALFKWKQHDPKARQQVFTQLLNLIRFPTMDAASLQKYVRPTGLLSSDVLLDMVLQGIGVQTEVAGRPSNSQYRGDLRSAKVIYVSSSPELNTALASIPSGGGVSLEEDKTKIILLPGDYSGNLEISKPLLTLVGFGPYTVFRGAQSILSLTSSQTSLSNCTFAGNTCLINVSGTLNTLKDIWVKESLAFFALGVTGSNNCFKNFSLQSKSGEGSSSSVHFDVMGFLALCRAVFGGNFLIDRLYMSRIIWSNGAKNTFSTFSCATPMSRRRSTVFSVLKAENAIEHVNCSVEEVTRLGAILSVEANGTGLYVSECNFESVNVLGSRNVFRNMGVGDGASISGSNNRFVDCTAGHFSDNGKNTVIKDCKVRILSGSGVKQGPIVVPYVASGKKK